jgi:hypothetical protein
VSTCRALPTNNYDFEVLDFSNITSFAAQVFTAVARTELQSSSDAAAFISRLMVHHLKSAAST